MGWTGVGACQCRTHMCHYMSSKSSSDSSPSPSSSTVSSVSWMRDPATMLRGLCVRRATVGTFSRRKSCLAHTEHTLSSRAVTATCARMHTRVNAYAYTSECGCALKHQNALQCVRMHVLQNGVRLHGVRCSMPFFGVRLPPLLCSRRPHWTFVPLSPSCRAESYKSRRARCAHGARCPSLGVSRHCRFALAVHIGRAGRLFKSRRARRANGAHCPLGRQVASAAAVLSRST